MKTLQEIKDAYAQSLDNGTFKDWDHYRQYNQIEDEDLDIIIEAYGYELAEKAKEQTIKSVSASLEKAAKNSRMILSGWVGGDEKWSMTEYKDIYVIDDGNNIILDKDSITSPDNIVLV